CARAAATRSLQGGGGGEPCRPGGFPPVRFRCRSSDPSAAAVGGGLSHPRSKYSSRLGKQALAEDFSADVVHLVLAQHLFGRIDFALYRVAFEQQQVTAVSKQRRGERHELAQSGDRPRGQLIHLE